MVTKVQLDGLLLDMESNLVERTTSTRQDKLGPVVCAFANDFPNYKQSGFILLGVNDDGKLAGKIWTDQELQSIGDIKTSGKVLPQPSITVSAVFKYSEGEVIVIEVKPSLYPPVRFDGICWIRLGPRRDKASVDEERILIERRASFAKTFDLVPALGSSLSDLAQDYFKLMYLPKAIDAETLAENGRTIEQQLASLRFFDLRENCPTNAGLLLFGYKPLYFLPGAYIQFIKIDGNDFSDRIDFEKIFSGPLVSELKNLDEFIKTIIIQVKPVWVGSLKENTVHNYPNLAIRELVMNAVMHRNYDSNAPIYIYQFKNRIEIINPGGLYGEVNANNFPNASDYRNIVLAEAMKTLGYVNRFNFGIKRAKEELIKNGNGEPEFDLTLGTKFKATVSINKLW